MFGTHRALQEWWGVDEEVRQHAAFIASKGYRAIVPDLYRGKLGLDAEEAHHLMTNLDFPGAVRCGAERQKTERKERGGKCCGSCSTF
jgi:dienelactone hydrolase